MKTSQPTEFNQDLFREELIQTINHKHPLKIMADKINWDKAEVIVQNWFSDKTGRPAKSSRLIVGLFLLKQMKNVSDEDLPMQWVENPYWQYFCGETYFQHTFPIHPTSMSQWRKKMSEEDAEKLLMLTIELGLETDTIKSTDMNRVNVDTTVQEKAVEYPTDVKLFAKAIEHLGKLVKETKLPIKQNYKFVSKKLLFKANNYYRASQFQRGKKVQNKLKTNLGRLVRDIQRQLEKQEPIKSLFTELIDKASRLLSQEKTSKNKLYSLHAPEVECIAKGKLKKRYEFGIKASVVATQRHNFIVGAMGLTNNPYDGRTLKSAFDQMEKLTGKRPLHGFVDNGYKGHSETQTQVHIARKKSTYATPYLKRLMKKRNAIEALFSHIKRDGQLGRNYLKGTHGDKLNVMLSAVGHNLRLILAMIRFFWLWIFTLWVLPIKWLSRNGLSRIYNSLVNFESGLFQV